jgi:hypothetical protein
LVHDNPVQFRAGIQSDNNGMIVGACATSNAVWLNSFIYRPMTLPFYDPRVLLDIRASYAAIWPAQIVAYALGSLAVAWLWTAPDRHMRELLGFLAVFWAWNGIAYHWMFFSAINQAAYLFGGMFVLQALLFIAVALRGGMSFGAVGAVRAVFG